MRPIALCALVLAGAVLASCGGDKGTGPSGAWPAPTPTPAGTPTGPVVTATIGAAGGTLQSDDGLVRLEIPAGALGSDTEIGIQRISALSPGAVGEAIRLTPDGLQFTAPVTLRMGYDSAMVDGSAPELLTIATQQADGTWLLIPDTDLALDRQAGDLVIHTAHFSDYTRLEGWQIRPASAEVDLGDPIILSVKNCTTVVDQSNGVSSAYAVDCAPPPVEVLQSEEDLVTELPTFTVDPSSWSVDSVPGGNSIVGTVAGNNVEAQYTAPQSLPPGDNTVAVSVKLRDKNGRAVTSLISHITIRNSCGAGTRAGGLLLRDLCGPTALDGFSQSILDDAHPLYRIDANVTWVYDSASSLPGSLLSFKAVGHASFAALDSCIAISPSQHSWQLNDQQSGGTLTLSLPDSTWNGVGLALWQATYTDTCDPNSTPGQAGAGGAWFGGSGHFSSDFVIAGTQTVGGQTFTFDFGPQTFLRAGTTRQR